MGVLYACMCITVSVVITHLTVFGGFTEVMVDVTVKQYKELLSHSLLSLGPFCRTSSPQSMCITKTKKYIIGYFGSASLLFLCHVKIIKYFSSHHHEW